MASVVLLHKVPAMWEVECKGDGGKNPGFSSDFDELTNLDESESDFFDSMRQDLFFLLAKSISKYLEIETVHVILCHDSSEKRNWDVIERNGVFRGGDGFVFWSSNSLEMMPKILDAQVLIVRGNYPNFHNKMINFYDPKSTIFYPATSLFFPHFGERMGNWVERVMLGYHDIDEIKLVISRLTEESIFSRVKPPVLRTPRSKTDDLQMRRLVRNYCLECIKISKSILTRESPGEYSIVLYDEKKNLEILTCKYPNATLLPFRKAPSPIFEIDLTSSRDIDILFTGTTIQRTKNAHLFNQIIDQLLVLMPELKVVIVGVEDGDEELKKRWPEQNVEILGRISKDQLCEVYNRSRIHLITSGRDCFPRTIPESVCCGCYNIVLDILSDGTSFIGENPIIGKIIPTTDLNPLLEPSYNISVELDNDFAKREILESIQTEHDHFTIATLGRNLLPLEQMIQLDKIWEHIDLSL